MKQALKTFSIVCIVLATGILFVPRPLMAQGEEEPLEVQPVTLSASEELVAQLSFFHRKADSHEEQILSPGSIIQLGDAYRISFTTRKDCYIYIFEHDASGKIVQLFPTDSDTGASSSQNSAPVYKDRSYHVPSGKNSWCHVRQPIIKRLSVVVSSSPDKELEEQYGFMLSGQEARNDFGTLLAQDELSRMLDAKNLSTITPVFQGRWVKTPSFRSPMIAAQIFQVLNLPFGTRGGDFEERALEPDTLKDLPTATLLNLFKRRSVEMLPESMPVLYEYGKILQGELADAVVVIAAHTDNQGDAQANQALAQARAEAVREFLMSHFQIAAERLPIYAYGGVQPLVSNENAEGRRLNNRIEFIRWK